MTSLTGKFELEYEGELRGAEQVAGELVRSAIGKVFQECFEKTDFQQVVQWFELGGSLKLSSDAPAREVLEQCRQIQGLAESASSVAKEAAANPALLAAACEFVLEGLCALRKISRNHERGFYAEERPRVEPAPREGTPRPRRTYQ